MPHDEFGQATETICSSSLSAAANFLLSIGRSKATGRGAIRLRLASMSTRQDDVTQRLQYTTTQKGTFIQNDRESQIYTFAMGGHSKRFRHYPTVLRVATVLFSDMLCSSTGDRLASIAVFFVDGI
jgi:hypothetical protein